MLFLFDLRNNHVLAAENDLRPGSSCRPKASLWKDTSDLER